MEEPKVEPVDEKLTRNKSNFLRRVTRMNKNRMPKIMQNFKPDGRRRLGIHLNRLLYEAAIDLSRPNS
jgi:hypothetical protein